MMNPNPPDRSLSKSPQISPEKQSELIELASRGLTIQKITEIAGVSYTTISRFLVRDPLFSKAWHGARLIGGDVLADELYHAYDGVNSFVDAMVAKGRSDNIRTIAAWRNPARYGPKLNVDVTHSVDLSGALQQAETRTIPILEQALIDRKAQSEAYDLGAETQPIADVKNSNEENQVVGSTHYTRLNAENAPISSSETESIPPVDQGHVTVQQYQYNQHVKDLRQKQQQSDLSSPIDTEIVRGQGIEDLL